MTNDQVLRKFLEKSITETEYLALKQRVFIIDQFWNGKDSFAEDVTGSIWLYVHLSTSHR